jgi:hypothetical protein
MDVADEPARDLAVDLERQDRERARIGHGEEVRLEDAGEALDRRAVEAEALLERFLERVARHDEALELAENVGEPQRHHLHLVTIRAVDHFLPQLLRRLALRGDAMRAALDPTVRGGSPRLHLRCRFRPDFRFRGHGHSSF